MKDEVIIDVKEIWNRILRKWKILIFTAIIGAFLVDIIGYINSYKDYEKNQPVDEKTLEMYKERLSEKDLEAAEQAYDTYEVYKRQYQSALEYSQNSILMKLGTDNAATTTIQYYIDNHYKSIYPVIQQTNNASDIIEAYSLWLTSDEVLDKVKENTTTDVEERYLKELINVEPLEDTQTMKITIRTNSRDFTNGIADVIEQEVESYKSNIQDQYGEFDIVGANRSDTMDIDDEVFDLQQKEITSIATLATQVEAVGNNLNDTQKTYYNALINNAESQGKSFKGNIVDKKNIVVGCALGIALISCYVFIKYILQKKLRNGNDLKEIYHSYTFGIIKKDDRDILNDVVKQIATFTIRKDVKKIGLIGTNVSEDSKAVFRKITSALKNEKLEVCCAYGINEIADLFKGSEQIAQVVLIEKKNGSTYEDIEREMEMCERCGIEILGNVIVDSE